MQVPSPFPASVIRAPSPTAACTCEHWVHCDHACHGRQCDPTETNCDIAFLPDEGGLTRVGLLGVHAGRGRPALPRLRADRLARSDAAHRLGLRSVLRASRASLSRPALARHPSRYHDAAMTEIHPQPRHPVPDAHLRRAPRRRHRGRRASCRLGPPPPRARPARLPRPARSVRHHPGRRRRGRCARGARCRRALPERVRRRGRRASSASACRERTTPASGPARSRSRLGRSGSSPSRRRHPSTSTRPDAPVDEAVRLAVPLPRHPPRADAATNAPSFAPGLGHPARPRGARVRRDRDADPHQEHAGGGPRLRRPLAPPAGHGLRAARRAPSSSSSC